ncbi:MAG: phosphoribosylglycinamide formyltransferase [Chloroflexota bacterium]|nr:phosphoribosylglycinamide formyltransferase [Ardenticatenaceae bacterium]GIK58416.1 MAG: phosphoribosylglycinamide formyltransferase [Chloroflexota bacterium]
MAKLNIVVFISGSGSNLQAIIDAVRSGELDANITLVVSNRRDAYGLVRARENGIPTLYHPFKPYRDAGKSREAYEADLAEKVRPLNPDLLVLAGWMHVLGAQFLNQFPNRVINLHPALPGQFAGTHAIERAYEAYQRGEISHSGCMVHLTIPEVDAGPVITQAIVPIYPEDTLRQFETRMHQTEHRIIVEAICLYSASCQV